MPNEKEKLLPDGSESRQSTGQGGNTATLDPKTKRKPNTKPKPPGLLPLWKVLLHNDDVNSLEHVIFTVMELTPLDQDEAIQRTLEADREGLALLLVTHKERAELYQEQFQSKHLTVTIEPDE